MTNYEQKYNTIITNLKNKNSADIYNVVKAYDFAKEKHNGQFRKGGDPYIIHPVEVASILEKLDFNTDVIASALLHDTVEDCGVTIKDIETEFNKQIAEIVDSVTAITKENYTLDSDNLYAEQDFLKLAVDDKTYQKLITLGKQNKFGFYIKFADRVNNLQTIGCFAKYKKEAKVKETEKWIIPLTKLLKTKYFYDTLTNYCFLISNEEKSSKYLAFLNRFYDNAKVYISQLTDYIKNEISMYLPSLKSNLSLFKVLIEPKTEKEIFDEISERFEINNIEKIKESNLVFVSLFNIYIIFNENLTNIHNLSLLYELLTETNLNTIFSCIGYSQDELGNKFLKVQDKIRNLYDITLLSRHEYTIMKNGTIKGTDIDMLDETTAERIETKYISIITPSNDRIRIPENSTVLDFAFRLHNDVGFSCKYAFINDSPNRSPIYTKLNDGDKVEIVCELKDGININVATLKWLAYCENEYTKRALIKYFEKKFNHQ